MISQVLVRFAQDVTVNGSRYETNLPNVQASSDNVTIALQYIFALIGAFAVIYIIYAGIHFITSQGDPAGIAKARQSIIYAVIGLIVAVSAELIVTFAIGRL